MAVRLTTWNINSIRLRLPLIERLLKESSPDIICLQETKVADEQFPLDAVKAIGFPHVAFRGEKSYNGVAILSKLPFADVEKRDWAGRRDSRHLAVRFENGARLHNFYVPAGGDIPDPAVNDKFDHKLRFLDEMTAWGGDHAASNAKQMIMVGDLNIAPLEADVWSHKQLLKVVSHTPVEVERLARVQAALGWVDAVRKVIPETEKLYSWWSYRARDWSKADRGRRLDHVWVSRDMGEQVKAAEVLRDARGWEKPSDHAPVTVTLDW